MSALILTPAQQEVVAELDARINSNTAAIENDRQARERIMSLGHSSANGTPHVAAPPVLPGAAVRGKATPSKPNEALATVRTMKGRELVAYALSQLGGESTIAEVTDYLRGLGLRRNEPRHKLAAQLYQAVRAGDGKAFLQNATTGRWRVINQK